MTELNDLASRLLRFEQQLTASQKLCADELAELWQLLDECKCALIAALPPQDSDGHFKDSLVASKDITSEPE